MDAINRTTLSGKLANTNKVTNKVKFQTYDDYERMQDLIDSCARLRVVPVAWMESWAEIQDDPVTCGNMIKRLISDWEHIDEKCQISEADSEEVSSLYARIVS